MLQLWSVIHIYIYIYTCRDAYTYIHTHTRRGSIDGRPGSPPTPCGVGCGAAVVAAMQRACEMAPRDCRLEVH